MSFREFCSIDFARLRPGVRSVAVGSVLTPACFQYEGRKVFSDRCIWDCGALGSWDHIAWQCPDRPCHVPMPRYPVQARFGWTISGGDFNVVMWLGQVVEKIWSVRYERERST